MSKNIEGVGGDFPVERGNFPEAEQSDNSLEISAGDKNDPVAAESEFVDLSDIVSDEGEDVSPDVSGEDDESLTSGEAQPPSDDAVPALQHAGEGGNEPPEVPPVVPAGDDPEESGNEEGELLETGPEVELSAEDIKEQTAEDVAAFLLQYERAVIDEDGPADASTLRLFTYETGILVDFEEGEKKQAFTLPGKAVVTTEIAYYEQQSIPDESDMEVANEAEDSSDTEPEKVVLVARASLEISVPDQRYADDNPYPPAPLVKYEMKMVGEDLIKTVTRGESATTVLVGAEEAAAFLDTFNDAMQTAEYDESLSPDERDEQYREDVRQVLQESNDFDAEVAERTDDQPAAALQELLALKPEVVYVKPNDRLNYELEDLLAFIASAPRMAKNEADMPSRVDPNRPEVRVSAAQIDALPFVEDVTEAREIAMHLLDAEKEYDKLEQAGAVVPRHARFVVRDVDTHKALVFTAALDANAEPLVRSDSPAPEDSLDHERAAEIASNYMTACLEDGSLMVWSCNPGFWSKGGVPDVGATFVQHDLESMAVELFDLSQWLDELPPSPKVIALRQKTRQQRESVRGITGW